MLERIGIVLTLIAAVYGIGDWLWRLAVRLLFPRVLPTVHLLLLDGDAEQVEYAIRSWRATRGRERLLLVDRSLSENGTALVRRMSEVFSLQLCTVDDLPKMITNGLQAEKKGV